MSDSAGISYITGASVAGCATLVYGYFSFFPRNECGSKIAISMMIMALMQTISQGSLQLDLGGTLRSDGVEFNFERWISFAVAFAFISDVLSAYNWLNFIDGWTLNIMGALTGICVILSGISTGNRRWMWIAFSWLFGIIHLLTLWFRITWFYRPEKSYANKWWTTIFNVLFILAALLAMIAFIVSSALTGAANSRSVVWLYFTSTIVLVLSPLIVMFTYEPDQVHKLE